jgi:aminopeptidase
MNDTDRVKRLADLLVRFGANVQPGQIVSVSSEPGKEPLARAVAEAAYRHGAKFVDVSVFDPYVKRSRALHADPDTLGFVPPWYGQRMLAIGEHRCATIALTGPTDPHLMDGVAPERLGKDMLPSIRESQVVIQDQTTNWTVGPCPTVGWARIVYPELEPAAALEQLWTDVGRVCRLDEPDPVAAWRRRHDHLLAVAATLNTLALDRVRFTGPGTDLTVGLLPGSRFIGTRLTTVDGIVHAPNLPTEEIFTTPDPERTEGVVTSTKPLFVSGALLTGLQIRFERGNAVQIDADGGADVLRGFADRDPGACRLGELALVDRESRVGQLGTVFYDTLLDENAACHVALGQGFGFAVEGNDSIARVNRSEIHVDFMIGADDVDVTGTSADGTEIPLLRGGVWQV